MRRAIGTFSRGRRGLTGAVRKEPFDRTTWRGDLAGWCARHLRSPLAEVLFVDGWQSAAVGVRLADGREVVVKVRHDRANLAGCWAVHRAVFKAGFPCPEPLLGPTPFGNYAATAEELESRGSIVAASDARPEPFAALLAHLLSLAPSAEKIPTLNPPPAWAYWSHSGGSLWPPRTTAGEIEMNDYPEPSWLTNAASAAQSRLNVHHLPDVVGHCDWESQNIRWSDSKAVVVHDWDSACTLPEAAIVGMAAAVFPATGGDEAATVDQSGEFISAYLKETGRPWSAGEHSVAWAAGLWTLAYNAKGCFIGGDGGPVADRLETESELRLARLDGC